MTEIGHTGEREAAHRQLHLTAREARRAALNAGPRTTTVTSIKQTDTRFTIAPRLAEISEATFARFTGECDRYFGVLQAEHLGVGVFGRIGDVGLYIARGDLRGA